MEAWDLLGLIFFGLLTGVAVLVQLVSALDRSNPRRFEQRDRVAERHRRIARNGFKSRAGIR